jgi:hypothetical protein
MTDTKTETTAHGQIEYETECCAYCDTDTIAENAIRVVTSGRLRVREIKGTKRVKASDLSVSFLCPMCSESLFGYVADGVTIRPGPIPWPERIASVSLKLLLILLHVWMGLGIAIGVILA